MRDLRLEEIPFEFDGKTYMLRCNMNVLADIQDAHDGNIGAALDPKHATRSVNEILAAMLNDYADEQGWDEHWTAKMVGRKLGFHDSPAKTVLGLFTRSLIPPDAGEKNVTTADTAADQAEPCNPGN